MRKMKNTFLIRLSVLAACAWCAALSGADWPQWRGPNRDGVWSETGVIDRFPADPIPRLWTAAVGPGYSSPTVAHGRVYLTDRQTSPQAVERVLCFDARTGRRLWVYSYPCEYKGFQYRGGPRAAVTVSDGRAFALGAMGHMHCLAADTGVVLWSRNLNEEYHIRMPRWGVACAPLVTDDLVVVQFGGRGACVAAFDAATGKERWKALDDPASYSAPILIEQAGRRVLACLTGKRVVGLDPASGRLLWESPFPPYATPAGTAMPATDGRRLFVSAFFEGGLMLRLRQDEPKVEEVWRLRGRVKQHDKGLHAMISTPFLDGDYLYGVDSYGELRCLHAATGEWIWTSLKMRPKARWTDKRRPYDRWYTAHLVRNRGRVWAFNEKGELIICRLTPQGYQEISRAQLIEPTRVQHPRGVCWSHPAFAYRCVFIRNDKELVCADLAKRPRRIP